MSVARARRATNVRTFDVPDLAKAKPSFVERGEDVHVAAMHVAFAARPNDERPELGVADYWRALPHDEKRRYLDLVSVVVAFSPKR